MTDVYRSIPVPSLTRRPWSLRVLADWSLGLALWDDRSGPGGETDELIDGGILDRSAHELQELLAAVEKFRIDH